MSNVTMWALIVGSLLPPIVAFVQQASWPPWARSLAAVLSSLVAAAGTVLIEHGWAWRTWISSALLIVVTALTTYEHFWKKTGIAPAIEHETTKLIGSKAAKKRPKHHPRR